MPSEAIACYQHALQARPNYSMAYGNFCCCYFYFLCIRSMQRCGIVINGHLEIILFSSKKYAYGVLVGIYYMNHFLLLTCHESLYILYIAIMIYALIF